MEGLTAFAVIGLVTGAIYAIAASGLVLTYATSNVFNIAHGAIGMVMAFVFWELHVARAVPAPLAVGIVLFVLAPASGIVLERVLMRSLVHAPVAVSLTATLGLMLALVGGAQLMWPPTTTRLLPGFAPGSGLSIAGVQVTYHELVTLAAAATVAGVLYVLLRWTRMGIAMRAVVDDRGLLALAGTRPDRVTALSWALGSSLAALAGILLAPVLQLDHLLLTLLVINAYAAAIVGRLRSLPLTFAGAIALGLLESLAVRTLPSAPLVRGLRNVLPTILLFVVLLLMPQVRLRVGRPAGSWRPRLPSLPATAVAGGALVVATAALTAIVGEADAARLGEALCYSLIMLSLVLLTGAGGQLSLCQMTFAGLGAYTVAAVGSGSPLVLLAAILAAAAVGAVVALPALRLQGLYLGLATMAFAVFADHLFFRNTAIFGLAGAVEVARIDVPGVDLTTEGGYAVFLAAVFALVGVGLVALRRGRLGRLLAAVGDSPTACATMGVNIVGVRLLVFALSAGIAGLAGALFGGLRGLVAPGDFEMLRSLPLLLIAVVVGINSVSGVLLGGLLYTLLPVVQDRLPELRGAELVAVGVAAAWFVGNRRGLAPTIAEWGQRLLPRRVTVPAERSAAGVIAS